MRVDDDCFAASAACAGHAVEKREVRSRRPVTVPALPLRKLISSRYWKLILIAAGLAAADTALLWAGHELARHPLRWGPGARAAFSLESGTAARFLGGILLLVSAQIAALIGWIRSRSPEDFDGRYRVWSWVAAAWFLFGVAVLTGAPQALSATMEWRFGVFLWQQPTLTWLVPSYVVALSMLWCLHRDMLGCRISLTLLALAGLSAALAGLCSLQLLDDPDRLLGAAAMLSTQTLIFLSMLVHARFVLYETNDPPPLRRRVVTRARRRPARWLGVVRVGLAPAKWAVALVRLVRIPSRWKRPDAARSESRRPSRSSNNSRSTRTSRNSTDADAGAQASKSSQTTGRAKSKNARTSQASARRRVEKPQADAAAERDAGSAARPVRIDSPAADGTGTKHAPQSDSPSKAAESDAATSSAAESAEPSSAKTSHSAGKSDSGRATSAAQADGGSSESPHISPEELKGLSKRQRRELRKQRRQQQRAARK